MARPKSGKGTVFAIITLVFLVILACGAGYVGARLAAAGVFAAFNLRLIFIFAMVAALFFLLCAATKNTAINVFAIVLEILLIAAIAVGFTLFLKADRTIAAITTPADAPAAEQQVTTQVNVLVRQGVITSYGQLAGGDVGYSTECSDAQLEYVGSVLSACPVAQLRLIGSSSDTFTALLNGEIDAAVIPVNYYLILTEEVYPDNKTDPAILDTLDITESLASAMSNVNANAGVSAGTETTPAEVPAEAPAEAPEASVEENAVEAAERGIGTSIPGSVETVPVGEQNDTFELSPENLANAPAAIEEGNTDVSLDVEKLSDEQLNEIVSTNSDNTFIVYFSGIDSYGDISTVSRSDVNIIAAINFSTHKIQLVSIPRDYYLPISVSEGGLKDKLTHCGLYGVQCSMDTLSAAFGIDFDYYVRLNFSGFIDIVNAIGGVDVYNDSYFVQSEYVFPEGEIHLEDTSALYFVRHRRTIGDSNRGGNHMKVIQAIVDKVCSSPEILLNYNEILNSVANSFQTDFTPELIYSLVSQQVTDGRSWEIEQYIVAGYGSESSDTYSMWSTPVYVLIPDYSTVDEARGLLEAVLNGD